MMLGSQCSPCCDKCPADGKPRTDPKDEGTWVPSGSWRNGGVTWTFSENPGDESGETWFFYGSFSTSKKGGGASTLEQQDWGNLCNWYSSKQTRPDIATFVSLPSSFDKRATRLPPDDAVVHIYTRVRTASTGPVTVKNAYFWGTSRLVGSSDLTTTSPAFDSNAGCVFNSDSFNSEYSTVNGGATFNGNSQNASGATVNDGAAFNGASRNAEAITAGALQIAEATVNGGAIFRDTSRNWGGTVNGGAAFYDSASNVGTINGGAEFYDLTTSGPLFPPETFPGIVNDGATFRDFSNNSGTVFGGALFYGESTNGRGSGGGVYGGAVFYEQSRFVAGFVEGGATFYDAACSQSVYSGRFAAHPTDLPTCNGSAPTYAFRPFGTNCGCG